MNKRMLLLILAVLASEATAQTIYVPGGAVGTSSNGNVGIGGFASRQWQ